MVTKTDTAKILTKWADPVFFVQHVLHEPLFRKQGEILRSIKADPFVSVVGANGTGKDWTAARAILWWLCMNKEAIVVVLAPTHRQVQDVIWKEVRVGYTAAMNNGKPLGGTIAKVPRWEINDRRFAVGFATDSEFNIQGYHSPKLLLVITEAHAVEDSHIDAGMRLNPSRVLMTGNPFTNSGKFYESHHSERDLWKTHEISAFDSPNVINKNDDVPGLVSWSQVERRKLELGEDNPMYIGSILGKFPAELDDTLIPLSVAKKAIGKVIKPTGPVTIGVDVAREGADKTVVVRRQGGQARIIWSVQGYDTQQIAGFLGRYMLDNPAADEDRGYCVIDTVGIGAGVFDALATGSYSYELQEFKGGSKAIDSERFKDRNAEAWYSIREALYDDDLDIGQACSQYPNCKCKQTATGCGSVNDDTLQRLVAQLASRQYTIEGDRRIKLESKDILRKKGKRSPDEADALAMTYSVVEKILEVW